MNKRKILAIIYTVLTVIVSLPVLMYLTELTQTEYEIQSYTVILFVILSIVFAVHVIINVAYYIGGRFGMICGIVGMSVTTLLLIFFALAFGFAMKGEDGEFFVSALIVFGAYAVIELGMNIALFVLCRREKLKGKR